MTVDGRNHRLGAALDGREVDVHALHETGDLVNRVLCLAIDAGEHRQVGAHAEVLLVLRGKHDHAYGRVLAQLAKRSRELAHQLFGDAVVALAMHDHARDCAVALDVDKLAH